MVKKIPENPENLGIPKRSDLQYNEKLVSEASRSIGIFNALVSQNKHLDVEIFLPLLIKKEAEASSRIEGTQVTFKEIFSGDVADLDRLPRSPKKEALGLEHAIKVGKDLSKQHDAISFRFITRVHKALMRHATLDQGIPGEYRKCTVYVKNYTPPEAQHISNLMSNLEKYIHSNKENIPSIVKIAIIHAQFEIIHPFEDGNGRIGRLLISFLMKKYDLTDDVSFFISSYFEKRRDEYHNKLFQITKNGDWNQWIDFFLSSCVQYCNSLQKDMNNIFELYLDDTFLNLKSQDSNHIKNYIFQHPIFNVPSMIKHFNEKQIKLTDEKNMHDKLKKMFQISILEQGKGRKKTIYQCLEIMKLIKNIGN